MTLLFLVLISRIYYVQVVQGAEWYERAKTRWSANEELVAKRGTITDRNGNVLAMDTNAYNVAVNPQAIHDADLTEEVIDGLHDILGKPKDELRKLLIRSGALCFERRDDGEELWGLRERNRAELGNR